MTQSMYVFKLLIFSILSTSTIHIAVCLCYVIRRAGSQTKPSVWTHWSKDFVDNIWSQGTASIGPNSDFNLTLDLTFQIIKGEERL